jgi:hypothetical protein
MLAREHLHQLAEGGHGEAPKRGMIAALQRLHGRKNEAKVLERGAASLEPAARLPGARLVVPADEPPFAEAGDGAA